MNKARPKRVWPTCGCCELLMAPRAFRKYGPPIKQAIAEQLADYDPEYDQAMDRLLDWELAHGREHAPVPIIGPDFEIVTRYDLT